MAVDLSKYFAEMKAEEKYPREIWKKTWHIEYFLFSFNKSMFGFVHHHWFPAGTWENPCAEYDFVYKKGFQLFDYEYKNETWECEVDLAKSDRDYDKGKIDYHIGKNWKFILNIKCIPLLVYKEECVGWKDNEGEHYYKKMKWGI